MDNRRPPPSDDRDPKIADAAALFRDVPAPASPPPVKAPRHDAAADDYAVEDLPDDVRVRPVLPPAAAPKVAKTPRPDIPSDSKPSLSESSATVEQVWSRGAEWGGTLALLGFAVLGVLCLMFVLLSNEKFSWAFLVLMASVPFLVFVAYPILVTLERPVRITPEQAIRDFYSAVSHHFPHYRRMWLLLSSEGRISGSFGSFEGFQRYWKKRLTELRAGKAGDFTPLKFQIEDFRSEKSAGLTHINVIYTVNIFIRGQQDEGPVGSMKVTMSLVKGPDRMWYLNKGTLP